MCVHSVEWMDDGVNEQPEPEKIEILCENSALHWVSVFGVEESVTPNIWHNDDDRLGRCRAPNTCIRRCRTHDSRRVFTSFHLSRT